MTTINEIAKIAGVSRGTVDRVLNNRSGVNPQTAERIRQIASSLNYSPNIAGRSLAARKKALKFGVILCSDISLFDSIENGVDRKAIELSEYGVELIKIHVPFNHVESQLKAMETLASYGVRGLTLSPVDSPIITNMINQLYSNGILTVTYNSDAETSQRIAYVGSDYRECGRVAGNVIALLSGLQETSIAIVSGNMITLTHPERTSSCMQKLKNEHPQINIAASVSCRETDTDAYDTVSRLLFEHPEINLFFFNDLGTRGGIKAVQDSGRHIRTILYDRVGPFREDLRRGSISLIITQQPWILGELPLDILFRYFALGIRPVDKCYLTNTEIKVAENLREPCTLYQMET